MIKEVGGVITKDNSIGGCAAGTGRAGGQQRQEELNVRVKKEVERCRRVPREVVRSESDGCSSWKDRGGAIVGTTIGISSRIECVWSRHNVMHKIKIKKRLKKLISNNYRF